jgi:predicted GIY-YIG superfamily endonuclease
MAIMKNKVTALYRYYSADNELLYVGISKSVFERLSQHKANAKWFKDSVRVEYINYPDRKSALLAEEHAIKTENPKFNITHNTVINKRKPIGSGYKKSPIPEVSIKRDYKVFAAIEEGTGEAFVYLTPELMEAIKNNNIYVYGDMMAAMDNAYAFNIKERKQKTKKTIRKASVANIDHKKDGQQYEVIDGFVSDKLSNHILSHMNKKWRL